MSSKTISQPAQANILTQQKTPKLTYFKLATSDNTRKAYQSDIKAFIEWGGLLPTTTSQLLTYLEDQAEQLNPRSLSRRVTALKQWHTYQQVPDPTDHPLIKKTLSGIRRMHGQPKKQASALTLKELEKIIDMLKADSSLTSTRNQALLLIGFFAALRGSELVSITIDQLQWEDEGLRIILHKTKTDKKREGQIVSIPYRKHLCAIIALKNWIKIANITEGPVFRGITKSQKVKPHKLNAGSLNPLLQMLANKAGLSNPENFSSHSLRRGLATEASKQGASIKSIMRQGRWKDIRTVLGYIEESDAFNNSLIHNL
jgi:integrase